MDPNRMDPLKKYVISHVSIPLEIMPDGSYVTLTDYLSMDFSECTELLEMTPEKKRNAMNESNAKLKEMIKNAFKASDLESVTRLDDSTDLHSESFPCGTDSKSATGDSPSSDQVENNVSVDRIIVQYNDIIRKKKRGHNTTFRKTLGNALGNALSSESTNKQRYTLKNREYDK